jgi:diguanylate cyclase (GGDEF)-like protein
MEQGDRSLEDATRAVRARERDRPFRLRWTASTAASYTLDAAFMALFVAAGTIPARVLAVVACGAVAICVATYLLYASGWNLRFRDPNVTWPQTGAAALLHLAIVAFAPQAAFPLLTNLFTVFAFGFLWMSLRASIVLCALSMAATGAVLWLVRERAGIAVGSPFEALITWLCFCAVLARFLVLSVFANQLRARLGEGRRRLAASLAQVQELVNLDELTRIANRRSLMQQLEQERGRSERTGSAFCVALMDLDHFKQVNDRHGHGAGDEVLRRYARAVQRTMRETDIFGRYGGEEFLLILTATPPAGARVPLERIAAALAAADWPAIAPGLRVTQSAGVAGFRRGESVSALLRRADEALYAAKAAGRDRFVVQE